MRIFSLKMRITLAVAALLSLFLIAGTIWGVTYFKWDIGRTTARQQHIVALAVADHIDHMLEVYAGELNRSAKKLRPDILVRSGAAVAYLKSEGKARQLFHNHLMLLTPAGKTAALSSGAAGRVGEDFSGQPFFLRTLRHKAPIISDPLQLSPGGPFAILFTAPVLDVRGRVRAILVGSVPLQGDELLGALGRVNLHDSAGFFLRGPGWQAQIASAGKTQRWTLRHSPAGLAKTARNPARQEVISASARLQRKDWEVVAHFPKAVAFASLRRAEHLFFAILLPLGVALSWLIVWFLMRRLTAPLQALTLHVRQMQRGEKEPFPTAGVQKDEIGLLAEEFNRLLASVKEHEQRTDDQLLFLQTLLDTIPNPVYYKDTEGSYLGGNKAFEGLLGERREQFVGRVDAELAPPLAVAGARRAEEPPKQQRVIQVYESAIRLPDGGERAVIVYKAPFFRQDGREGGVVGILLDISERKLAEKRSEQTLSLLRTTLEATADGILVVDLAGRIALYNQRFVEMWRMPAELLKSGDGHPALAFIAEQLQDPATYLETVEGTGRASAEERSMVLHFRDGRIFESYSGPQRLGTEIVGRVCCFRDITTQQKLERQLNQAQKMEAIGTLAGGVAHDFNNLLTVINGYSTLLVRDLHGEGELAANAQLILDAGNRAADLTRQLLAFSRRQVLEPQVLELNELIRNFEKMLRRLIREDISIEMELQEALGSVRADPGQLEQVLLNLAVNARDAIEGRGKITITTAETELEESFLQQHPGSLPGRYVMFSVADTGCGMNEEVQAQVFEPFFTTKEPGRGTGLGLATVYGIVKQSAGYITVESTPGRGTLFSVYLPRVEAVPLPAAAPEPSAAAGGGCLLLVEDQREVLQLAAETLSLRGFTVITAASAEEAMGRFSSRKVPIDLLVTDVVMPGLSGLELAERLRKEVPSLPVLYISGYSDIHSQPAYSPAPGEAFLQKPFTGETLVAKVQEMLHPAKP